MNLRSKIIRLAHQNPDLRPHLLPLLSRTAAEKITIDEILRMGRSPLQKERTLYEKAVKKLWDREGGEAVSYNPAGGQADDVDLLQVRDATELPRVQGVGRVAVVQNRGYRTLQVGRRTGYYWSWYILLDDN